MDPVSSIIPQTWAGVITQGRGDLDEWVTSFMVLYSNDGVNWDAVDNGKVFQGNSDRDTQVTNWFDTPVTARTLQIKPTSWSGWISMRFDALFYLDQYKPEELEIENIPEPNHIKRRRTLKNSKSRKKTVNQKEMD